MYQSLDPRIGIGQSGLFGIQNNRHVTSVHLHHAATTKDESTKDESSFSTGIKQKYSLPTMMLKSMMNKSCLEKVLPFIDI